MLLFEWILLLLFAAVVVANLAERLAVPYPSLLAIAGACLAFLPFAPQIAIEPELALALFVAPALLDAISLLLNLPGLSLDQREFLFCILQISTYLLQALITRLSL